MRQAHRSQPKFLLLIGAVAVACRLAHAAFIAQTPFFEGPVIDAWTYRGMADHIAATGNYGGAFYQPPLYPAFLATLVRIGLGSAWAVAIVQALLGAVVAVMMAIVGARLASGLPRGQADRIGLATGIVAALYGPLVLFDIEVLPPVVVHVLLVGAWLLALRRQTRPGLLDAAGGFLVGLAVTGWGLALVLGLALPLHRLSHLRSRGAKIACVVIWLAATVPPIAFTASHNARHDGEGVIVSFNAGINLWLGNNPDWRGTWRARPGAEFEPELERPDREGVTRPADKTQYFLGIVWRDVSERPGAAVARTAEKLYYAWHGREIRRNQDIDYLRETSPVLHALTWEAGLFFPFGLLAPLAIAGLWRRREETDARVLAGAVLVYSMVLAVFFVSSRYRLPMALWLMPFAVDEVFSLVRERSRSVRRYVPFALALVALNAPAPFTATFAATDVEQTILTAHAWRNQGQPQRAVLVAQELAAGYPSDANVQMLYAEMLIAAGQCDLAVEPLQRVIDAAPQAATPRVMLGQCLDDLGDGEGAERAFAGALALHAYHAVALKGAADLYLRTGRLEDARALLERFTAQGYEDPEVERWLAELDSHGVR